MASSKIHIGHVLMGRSISGLETPGFPSGVCLPKLMIMMGMSAHLMQKGAKLKGEQPSMHLLRDLQAQGFHQAESSIQYSLLLHQLHSDACQGN